jgi:hypothetical protein
MCYVVGVAPNRKEASFGRLRSSRRALIPPTRLDRPPTVFGYQILILLLVVVGVAGAVEIQQPALPLSEYLPATKSSNTATMFCCVLPPTDMALSVGPKTSCRGLIRKRKEIARLIEDAQLKMGQLIIDLDNIDATIRLFRPDLDLEEIHPSHLPPRHSDYKGEMSRHALSALRNNGRAMTSKGPGVPRRGRTGPERPR